MHKSRTPAAAAAGASYLAGKESINGSGNARFLAQPAWRFQKSAPAAAAAGVKKPHHWRSTLYIFSKKCLVFHFVNNQKILAKFQSKTSNNIDLNWKPFARIIKLTTDVRNWANLENEIKLPFSTCMNSTQTELLKVWWTAQFLFLLSNKWFCINHSFRMWSIYHVVLHKQRILEHSKSRKKTWQSQCRPWFFSGLLNGFCCDDIQQYNVQQLIELSYIHCMCRKKPLLGEGGVMLCARLHLNRYCLKFLPIQNRWL